MPYIQIRDLVKSFPRQGGQKEIVVDRFSLSIEKGEFVTLFGPNGCGKTTLLNVISGTSDWDSGSVSIADKPPQAARIGYVFQNFADSLFPWRTNLDNLALPLELQRKSRRERYRQVTDFLTNLDIKIELGKFPYQMSVGQQQLIAIVRALLYEPELLIMDEPFGSLDYTTRLNLEDQVLHIWEKSGATVLFVSHDVDEGIYLGERLVLLTKRPTHVAEVIENALPRPRSTVTFGSPEFASMKARALSRFRQEVGG